MKSRRGRRSQGPRILIKGSPLDSPDFCAAIEAHGAIVVAEDDWWGSRAAGRDIDATIDPMRAIFEKYYFDAPSPRVFPCRNCRRLVSIARHPRWTASSSICRTRTTSSVGIIRACARFLDERAIPHLMLRDESSDEIGAFIERLSKWLKSNWNAPFAPPASEGLVRSTARGCVRKAEAVRHRAGRHAARTVPRDGRSGGEQSMVGRDGGRPSAWRLTIWTASTRWAITTACAAIAACRLRPRSPAIPRKRPGAVFRSPRCFRRG